RACDDDVDLLLLAVMVADRGTKTRGIAEIADPQMFRVQALAAEASFGSRCPFADRVFDFLEIDDRVVAHWSTIPIVSGRFNRRIRRRPRRPQPRTPCPLPARAA